MEGNATVERIDSCEISVNAKNQWSGKIKVYAETIDEAMDKAEEKANDLSKKIKDHNDAL